MDLDAALITIDLLRGQIAALDRQLVERDTRLRELEQSIARQSFELERMRRMLFGPRAERVAANDTPLLPGIDPTPAPATPPTHTTRVTAHDRTVDRAKRRARLALDSACVTDVHTTLAPPRTDCPCCGERLAQIRDEVRVVVERDPAHYTRTHTHRPVLACAHCKQAGLVVAPAEDPPITGAGPVGTRLAVDIAVRHFADHLPFHRLAGIFAREGLRIDRSTLSRVARRVARALRPIVATMTRELLERDAVVGIDGTGVEIFDRPHCRRGAVYVLHGEGHVVLRALPSEGAVDVLAGFEHFRGVVVCDAAKVHVGTHSAALGLAVALCNAHQPIRPTIRPGIGHRVRRFPILDEADADTRDLLLQQIEPRRDLGIGETVVTQEDDPDRENVAGARRRLRYRPLEGASLDQGSGGWRSPGPCELRCRVARKHLIRHQ